MQTCPQRSIGVIVASLMLRRFVFASYASMRCAGWWILSAIFFCFGDLLNIWELFESSEWTLYSKLILLGQTMRSLSGEKWPRRGMHLRRPCTCWQRGINCDMPLKMGTHTFHVLLFYCFKRVFWFMCGFIFQSGGGLLCTSGHQKRDLRGWGRTGLVPRFLGASLWKNVRRCVSMLDWKNIRTVKSSETMKGRDQEFEGRIIWQSVFLRTGL